MTFQVVLKKAQTFLDSVPHWVYVGVFLFLGAFWQNLKEQPDFWSAITSWQWQKVGSYAMSALGVALVALVGWLRTDPWMLSAKRKANRLIPPQGGSQPPMGGVGIIVMTLSCMIAISCRGSLPPPPPNTPGDVSAEIECLVTKLAVGETALPALAACTAGDEALASDLVTWLLSFASVKAKLAPENMAIIQHNIKAGHK